MKVFFYLSAALVLSGILLLGLRETSAGSVSGKTSVSGRGEPETEVFPETEPADVSRKPRSKIPDNSRIADK